MSNNEVINYFVPLKTE